ncbi:MAG: tetratricopeptide repeat protein [Bacteroidales bacterium]|jgi:class 3 adenylate cyclase|nr:tetratricopeptide repeat protein [Bacteroidales bacterium]
MQKVLLCLSFVLISTLSSAQNSQIDSLKSLLQGAEDDTIKVNTLITLANRSLNSDPEATILYGIQAKELAERLNYKRGLGYALKSIGMGHYFKAEYDDVLIYWQQSLSTFDSIGENSGVANMANNLGMVHFNQGDDTKAIEYLLQSLKVAEEIEDKLRIATALVNIGAVYSNKEATHDMALQYYTRSLPLSMELGNYEAIGTVAVNMGELFLKRNQYDSALFYFNTSLDAYERVGSVKVAYTLNNIGKVYAQQGDFEQAVKFQKEAIEKSKSLDAKLELTQALLGLAKTYHAQGNESLAIANYLEAQRTGEEIRAKNELKEIYEGLADSYAKTKDFTDAYRYQALYIIMKDSLYNEAMDKKLQFMTLSYDIEKKQRDIDLLTKDNALQELNLQRQRIATYAAGSTGFLLLVMAIGLFNRYKYVRKTKKIIEEEKDRSEKLLLNILPHETASELKEKGTATPKHYDKVSVLFTDFKGFTKIAEKLTAQELIEELNYCFFEFDKIIDKHNLEKIKTIGDAYMCAGGIPAANDTNPVDIVRAGLEIKAFMDRLREEREKQGKDYWELRIGIHTGEVVAGVVGKNKFAYDIWGDAVNTASRMESSGIPGQVNISGTTYEFIKGRFKCTHRGKIQAKNKGEIDMYIVEAEI